MNVSLTSQCRDATNLNDPDEENYCTNFDLGWEQQLCEFSSIRTCVPRAGSSGFLCRQGQQLGSCTGTCPTADLIQDTAPTSEAEATAEQVLLPRLQIDVPGLQPFTKPRIYQEGETQFLDIGFIGQYIVGLYKYLVGIVGILAGALYTWAGVRWLTSGGNPEKISDSKKKIASATMGLVLTLGSYLILYLVNPQLTVFEPLRIKYVERIPLELARAFGGGGGGDSPRGGIGNIAAANQTACPALTPGTRFPAAFTTYYNLSAREWGQAGEYNAIYKGNNPSLQGKGDFFCAVSMECGCPGGRGGTLNEKTCCNANGRCWKPCKFFTQETAYCRTSVGRYPLTPGQTVAASTCFPRPCKIRVGGRELQVTDRGSGIVGTHFDFYLGVRGEPGFVTDTSWLTTEAEIIDCRGTTGKNERQNMWNAYNGYAPGSCQPERNC